MIVQKEALVALLVSLGYPQADGTWEDDRILKKARALKGIPDVESKAESLSGPERELLKDILTATRKDKKVNFAENGEAVPVESGNESSPADKKAKKNKTPTKAKTNQKKAKPSANGSPTKSTHKGGSLSVLEAAIKLMTSNKKKPMKCKEIIEVLAQKDLWKSPGGKTPEATLNSKFLKEIAKGKGSRVKKTAPGTYNVK